jgi:hypothetical protein
MRRLLSLPLAALAVLVLSFPVLAARPTIVSFADDDVDDGALYTALCGFEVRSESSGHVVFHNQKRGANNFMANWNIQNWLFSANGSYHLIDAGPDMEHTRAGTTYLTVTGRSLTFSSVIGRTEVNLDTGEVVFHGNLVGSEALPEDWYAPICDALS